MQILKTENKKENAFLRRPTAPFDFSAYTKSEIRELIRDMRRAMKEADGVGLAANQVGINASFFVAEFDDKFYAFFNPEIVKRSGKTQPFEEGCLSVPGETVEVERAGEVTIKGFDRNGKRVKMRAWGFLAVILQHEVDHLNGKLITDYKK